MKDEIGLLEQAVKRGGVMPHVEIEDTDISALKQRHDQVFAYEAFGTGDQDSFQVSPRP